MSKILVTGGRLYRFTHRGSAYRAGHSVIVVDNLATGYRENVNPARVLRAGCALA